MRAAVLRPRALVLSRIERKLLPVADGPQPVGGDPERDEIGTGGDGAPLAQCQIVLGRSALVAVAFDCQHPGPVLLQYAGVLVECRLGGRAELGAVVLEEYWLQR